MVPAGRDAGQVIGKKGRARPLGPAAYLQKVRQEVEEWETAKRGVFSQVSDFLLNPAAKFTARAIPQSVRSAVTAGIEKTLRLTAEAGTFSVDAAGISKERSKRLGLKRAPGSRLRVCDSMASGHWRIHCGYAAAEGAATGVMGVAGLIADVPLLLSIAIREIRSIGLCYGYSVTEPYETDYMLHILRIGSSSEVAEKADALQTLGKLEEVLWQKGQHSGDVEETVSRVTHLITVQEYAKSLAVELVRRKTLQFVPVAGAVVAASYNAAYVNDVGRAAYMCYRRRFIHDAEHALPGIQVAVTGRKSR